MEMQTLLHQLQTTLLPAWELIPDFGLYMDQLTGFVDKSAGLSGNGALTKSMVNNYVKSGLVDRPAGKTYTRDSIAQLMMICRLKQVLTLDEMKELLHPYQGHTTEQIYSSFRLQQLSWIEQIAPEKPVDQNPLTYAMQASACQTICRMLLEENRAPQEEA